MTATMEHQALGQQRKVYGGNLCRKWRMDRFTELRSALSVSLGARAGKPVASLAKSKQKCQHSNPERTAATHCCWYPA